MTNQLIQVNPDLTNICVGTTQISKLALYNIVVRGYKLEDLITNLSYFEEMCYLLVFEKLPTLQELKQFQLKIHEQRVLPEQIKNQLKLLPKETSPLDVMKVILILIETFEPETSQHNSSDIFIRLLAVLGPGMLFWYNYSRYQIEINIQTESNDSYAENFLKLLYWKQKPDPILIDSLSKVLITISECGYSPNCTFTIHVVQSADCSIYQGVQAGICSWQGLRHGLASTQAMNIFSKLTSLDQAEEFVQEKFKKKEIIMGFGHKFFKPEHSDIRLKQVNDISNRLLSNGYQSNNVIKCMDFIKDKVQREKQLFPNLEFYFVKFFSFLQVESSLICTIVYLGRFAGQMAHFQEQRKSRLLFCPQSKYIGPDYKQFIPLDQRDKQIVNNQQQKNQVTNQSHSQAKL